MKKFYLLCMAVLACAASIAQPTITLVSTDGTWSSPLDWNPSRLPANGDIVVIPANRTLKVNQDVTVTDIHLTVYGKVTLVGKATIATLKGNSDVMVYTGGMIEGTEANQQLRIGNNIVYLGNKPPVVGPALATAAAPAFQPVTILPVKFLGFSLARQNSNVLVQWSTAEEINSHVFEVERSTDGANWSRVATVAAKGFTNSVSNYSITDKQVVAPVTHYRIRQVDADGHYSYTAVKTIRSTDAQNVTIAAINHRVVLQFPKEIKGAVEVRLVSLSGQVVSRQVVNQPMGQVVLPTTSVKGNYIVAVSNATDLNQARQVIL